MKAPSLTWNIFMEIAVRILGALLPLLSDEIRELVEESVLKLYEKAQATPNPWDDFMVGVLAKMLGIKLPT
jgi:hypothetical protein